MKSMQELIELLNLEKLDDCLFRGQNYITPWGRVFGGQVLAQGLKAAYETVPPDRIAHSMHGYFVLSGDVKQPIIYRVDTIRDGGSFTTRRVAAIQKGKAIFVMAASFQERQDGFDHQPSMPSVTPPDQLLRDFEQLKGLESDYPAMHLRLSMIHPNAFEFRPVEPPEAEVDPLNPARHVWLKASSSDTLDTSDLPLQHQLLAYASDYDLLITSILPYREEFYKRGNFIASLDHAMWFHRDFNVKDYLLYAIESPSASNSRGFARGKIFDQQGRLVASVMQEGLIRSFLKK